MTCCVWQFKNFVSFRTLFSKGIIICGKETNHNLAFRTEVMHLYQYYSEKKRVLEPLFYFILCPGINRFPFIKIVIWLYVWNGLLDWYFRFKRLRENILLYMRDPCPLFAGHRQRTLGCQFCCFFCKS
jgi:hypothetical protein